jgi:small subunit ribosomal protein S20
VPNTKSAEKRLRQATRRREHNRKIKSAIRTRTRKLLESDNADEASALLDDLYSRLDRAAAKNVMHRNTAARKKARLARHVEQLTG